jgi:molybdopterin-guanine dinucleotide biosynthesis protein A
MTLCRSDEGASVQMFRWQDRLLSGVLSRPTSARHHCLELLVGDTIPVLYRYWKAPSVMPVHAVEIPSRSVTVAILAGGMSTRFGSDKALAIVPGGTTTFLGRAVSMGNAVADRVLIIASDRPAYAQYGAELVPDGFPGEGPAGAVVTALNATHTAYLVVLACDQPMIAQRDLRALLVVLQTRSAAAFSDDGNSIQPLPCAFDVAQCREIANDAFATGTRSLSALLASCNVGAIDFADSVDALNRLFDVDTPEDHGRVAERLHGRREDESQ